MLFAWRLPAVLAAFNQGMDKAARQRPDRFVPPPFWSEEDPSRGWGLVFLLSFLFAILTCYVWLAFFR
jgi:hypothetical protein